MGAGEMREIRQMREKEYNSLQKWVGLATGFINPPYFRKNPSLPLVTCHLSLVTCHFKNTVHSLHYPLPVPINHEP
jgi:hypothetical protein